MNLKDIATTLHQATSVNEVTIALTALSTRILSELKSRDSEIAHRPGEIGTGNAVTNIERAKLIARMTLKHFQSMTGSDDECCLIDLLTNLMHATEHFDQCLESAKTHFCAEIEEDIYASLPSRLSMEDQS